MATSDPRPALARGEPFARAADAPAGLIDSLAARVREDATGRLIAWQADAEPREASHGELWERATRIAAGLRRQGVGEARVVVLLAPNVLDFVPALWACLRVGAVPLPFGSAVHSRQRLTLLGERLAALGRPILLVEDNFNAQGLPDHVWRNASLQRLSALEAVPPDAAAEPVTASGILVPTSGSTGRLQLAWLSPRVLLNRYLTRRLRPESSSRVVISPFPNDGVSGLGAAFLGYRDWVQLPPGGLATQPLSLLDAIERCRGETLFLSTSMALQIMAAAQGSARRWDLGCLRSVLVGAEPVVAGVMRELRDLLAVHGAGQCRIWAGYGATETGTLVEGADPTAWTDRDRGRLGKPLSGVSLRITGEDATTVCEGEEGEIEVFCREKLFTGYWGEPERMGLTEDGWWRTGDLGCLHNGQLRVLGRKKEVFIAHGRKFALADIDVSLQQALGTGVRVLSCLLAGDAGTPEQLAIAYAPLTADAVPEEITAMIQATLARGFGLRAGRIQPLDLDCLPLTVAGKPQRSELARQLAESTPLTPARAPAVPEAVAVVEAIWREILGDAAVRQPEARFAELGGESLQSALLFSLIKERLGQTLPMDVFFAEPTLHRLRQWAAAELPFPLTEGSEDAAPDEHLWPLPRELHQGLLSYLETWEGTRPTRNRLVVGHNVEGHRPPLFWCAAPQQQDLRRLAKHLGPAQPLYVFRSLNQLVSCTEDMIQRVALKYLHEIIEVYPDGPLFLGGACQGSAIMLAVAQHLFRRRRQILLLVLMEWDFPLQYFMGPVLLLYGRDSPFGNPFLRHRQPDLAWRHYFRDYSSEEIPGSHSAHYEHTQLFAERLNRHFDRALHQSFVRLPWNPYPASLRATDLPAKLSTGEQRQLTIGVENLASHAWGSGASGVWLGNYWMNAEDAIVTPLDGRTECPELRPGESVTLPLTITAPSQPGLYRVVVDLVEEGSHWLDPWRRSARVMAVEVA